MREANDYIGKQIGNYRVIRQLSTIGGFGSVFLGKHIVFTDRPIVAIKLLHAHLASKEEQERFLQEARFLEKLKHPHILPVIDAGIQEGLPFLIAEYATNGSLKDLLRRLSPKPLSLEEAVTILSQVGQALQHAHQQNIVHRDLKPDNILFNTSGEALLADFGIATVLDAARTKPVDSIGSPPYMAPEQFDGIVSMKSDQYALGCIAYELVTGRKPFILPQGASWLAWGYKHLAESPIAPSQLHSQLPPYLEQAILKAMAKQRVDRHASVLSFITALRKSSIQWYNEGSSLYELKRYGEALAAYEQAVRLDPSYTSAYIGKAAILNDLKRYAEALVTSEQAIRLAQNQILASYAYYNRGNTLQHLKRYEEALVAYEEAIRLDPNFASTYFNKGLALSDLKRYEEALLAYEQAIRLDPNNANVYRSKSVTLRYLKRYEEALDTSDTMIRLSSHDSIAYIHKGLAFSRLKRHEEALEAFQHATDLNPDSDEAYFEQGNVLFALERYEAALAAFEQAIRLNPGHEEAFLKKSHVFKRLGKTKEADEAYNHARLLTERIVSLDAPIDDNVAEMIIAQLLFLQSQDATRDINLHINSPGGFVAPALAIYDTMQWIKPDVSTLCVGEASGMATLLLAAGTKGKRYALPDCSLTLVPFGLDSIQTNAVNRETLRKLNDPVRIKLADHTGRALERITRDMVDEMLHLTAQDAMSYGIVDEVLTTEQYRELRHQS